MTKSQTMGARLGLAMLGAGMLFGAAPVSAQTGNPSLDGPGQALSRNLRSLAENPHSLSALLGAGKAALELGDPQAAITFFGRAEEQAPRDGRIKMWLGASLVQLGQAQGALKFFAEAVSLGAPEAEVAGARGLAYDFLGDPRRAQRDYRLALQAKPSAEVSRNLALSLAISGEREPALRVIEDQLLIRDRAAERTRAFVLALTGDAAGATRAVQASMPGQSAALSPFLERLPALSLTERALAVHLGQFPSHARNLPVPRPNTYASVGPSVTTRAGTPDSRQPALGARAMAVPKAEARPRVAQQAAASRQRTAPPVTGAQKPRVETAQRTESSRSSSVMPAWSWSRGMPETRRAEPAPRRANPPAAQQQAPPRSSVAAAIRDQQPTAIAQTTPQVSGPAQAQTPVAVAAARPEPQLQTPAAVASLPPQTASTPVASAPQAPVQAAAATRTGTVQTPIQTAAAASVIQAPIQTASALSSPVISQSTLTASGGPAAQAPLQTASAAPAINEALATPGFSLSASTQSLTAPRQEPVSELASVEAPPPAAAPVEERGASRLSDIASLIATLPEAAPDTPAPAANAAPKPVVKQTPTPAKAAPVAVKKEAPVKVAAKKETPAAKKEVVAKKPAAPAEPQRIWVQVAGGADKAALPREFTRIKSKAPKLLAARFAWTTPLKATNRLLVGPFKSDTEAQEFVNELKKADLSGFAWTSEAGQKIEKLAAK